MERRVLTKSPILLLCFLAGQATAAVTYNGTDGVYANIFNSNSQQACLDCHHSSLVGATDRQSAPDEVDFDTYANATDIPSYYSGNTSYRNSLRAKVRVADDATMPAVGPLTAAEQSLITQWINDGELLNDAPDVSTLSAISVGKYSATLRANNINENGANGSFYFRYATNSSLTGYSESSRYYPSGTGGGTATDSMSRTVSGLSCGTTYYFRAYGTNSQGTTSGSLLGFTTDACPQIDSIGTQSATEESSFYYNVNANMGGLTYSLDSAPATMGINASTGEISWTPDDPISSTESVIVRATDGTTADTEFFSINVTAVNDAPQITSTPSTSATEGNQYQYQVSVNDPDDSNDGTQLSFTLTQKPATMSVSSTGLVTWTPPNGTSSANVTVEVADGGEDGASPDTQSWTITVDAVNDPPVITSTAPTSATEDVEYQYQVQVDDPDDANNGSDLSFTLSNQPSGMSVSNTGLITWTPGEGVSSSGKVTVEVADGGENGASPDTEAFTVSVTAVNDPPVILPLSISDKSVEELSSFSLVLSEDDPDDANNGTDLTWSLTTAPTGMTISSTGTIEWTPGENTAGEHTVAVKLADGGEDGASADTDSFLLTVTLKDADGDGVADYNDNCVNTANAGQANFDGDAAGDACDPDDDNDGIDDTAEQANGLDPYDDSDASGDLDGDGLTNLEEFQTCASGGDTTCNAISVDSVAPVITVQDRKVESTGYLTEVTFDASAVDGIDGEVDVTPDNDGPFRPGRHTITWTASDSQGNTATETRTLDVLPRASVSGNDAVVEGSSVSIPVRLNGEAPVYPVKVDVVLAGTADSADHDLTSPISVSIVSGTEATITASIVNDGVPEGDESLTFRLDAVAGEAVAGPAVEYNLLIVERQLPPELAPQVRQNGIISSEVYQGEGTVQLSANGSDPNSDSLTYSWASVLPLTLAGDVAYLDPDAAGVSPGTYVVTVSAADPYVQVSEDMVVEIKAAADLPVLSSATDTDGDGVMDVTEGRGDSDGDGVPDYRDPVDSPEVQVVYQDDSSDPGTAALMKTDPGLTMVVGRDARKAGNDMASVASSAIKRSGGTPEDSGYTIIGWLYDFEVRGLSDAARSAQVVVPLDTTIAPETVWRKLDGNSWRYFVENGGDRLHSAMTGASGCPDPTASSWESGLRQGRDCVRLTLTDGGPNDADGQVNGVIVDPGGAAVPTAEEPDPVIPDDRANSGGNGWGWLVMLVLSGIVRRSAKQA